MIERINAIRAGHGLPALSENAMLTQAAHDHAADLSRNDWLIEQRRWHDGSDGSTIGERLTRAPWGFYWVVDFGRPVAAPVKQPCPCCGRGWM